MFSNGYNPRPGVDVEGTIRDGCIANGTRGQIVSIALHDGEESFPTACVVTLCEPPASVLIKLQSTKSGALPGLRDGVIPITPIERTFSLTETKRKQCQGTTLPCPLDRTLATPVP